MFLNLPQTSSVLQAVSSGQSVAMAMLTRTEEECFYVLVACDDVLTNDANLSVSGYVQKPDEREEVDIVALNAKIARIVVREQELRDAVDDCR